MDIAKLDHSIKCDEHFRRNVRRYVCERLYRRKGCRRTGDFVAGYNDIGCSFRFRAVEIKSYFIAVHADFDQARCADGERAIASTPFSRGLPKEERLLPAHVPVLFLLTTNFNLGPRRRDKYPSTHYPS